MARFALYTLTLPRTWDIVSRLHGNLPHYYVATAGYHRMIDSVAAANPI